MSSLSSQDVQLSATTISLFMGNSRAGIVVGDSMEDDPMSTGGHKETSKAATGEKRRIKPLSLVFVGLAVTALIAAGVLLGKTFFTNDTRSTLNEALAPLEIIETFEISSLEYRYRNLVFEENVEERKFVFIPLEPAVKRYAVQYDGAIKMGINAEDVKAEVEERPNEEKSALTVTIPNAYVLSHEAPLNDTLSVIFDESEHVEKFTIGEYADTLNEKKKETEAEADQSELLEQAQESARNQLDSFLRAIPDIRDNYTLVFVLE